MLKLFANMAASALASARHVEGLRLADAIAWMGVTYSDLTHDMATPIATLRLKLTNIQMASRRGSLSSEDLDARVTSALAEVDRLRATLSRTVQVLSPQRDTFELSERLACEVRKWCCADVALTVSVEPGCIVAMDAGHLESLVRTVTMNAVRAMRDSGERRFEVRAWRAGSAVWITFNSTLSRRAGSL